MDTVKENGADCFSSPIVYEAEIEGARPSSGKDSLNALLTHSRPMKKQYLAQE